MAKTVGRIEIYRIVVYVRRCHGEEGLLENKCFIYTDVLTPSPAAHFGNAPVLYTRRSDQ